MYRLKNSISGFMPPLSAFVGNESEAGKQCVKPCLDKAQGSVPSREHSNTPVLLGATAGMRILRLFFKIYSSKNESKELNNYNFCAALDDICF